MKGSAKAIANDLENVAVMELDGFCAKWRDDAPRAPASDPENF